ncbi:MAG TPA: helix-turn-helix domain-containing protein [Archangium sp.]|jgi:transposase
MDARTRHKQQSPRITVTLTEEDRGKLAMLMRTGRASARVFKRARVLQLLDEGKPCATVREALGVSQTLVRRIGVHYQEGGLRRALYEAPRPGAERLLTAEEEARIVAMVCTPAPEGYARWTLALIAREARARGLVKTVGRETIRLLLKSHALKPWREKNVVRAPAGQRVRAAHGGRAGALPEALHA